MNEKPNNVSEASASPEISLRTAITPEERVACWKMGAAFALAARGMLPSEFDAAVASAQGAGMHKEAQAKGLSLGAAWGATKAVTAGAVTTLPKFIGVTALVAGVPLGAVWHAVDRRAKMNRNKERDMEAQIDYYSEAGRQLEAAMALRGGRR